MGLYFILQVFAELAFATPTAAEWIGAIHFWTCLVSIIATHFGVRTILRQQAA
jgi:hypothetical protein